MARIRSIKPEFWQDELIGTLPFHLRLLFIGLWNVADDEGRFRANPLFIRAQVFPYDLDVDVAVGLQELVRVGRIQLYNSEGQSFGWVVKFGEHQRIDKPRASSLPAPPKARKQAREDSKNVPGTIQEPSREEGKGMEGSGREPGKEERGRKPVAAPAAAPLGSEKEEGGSALQELWNETAHPDLPRWKEMGRARRKAARARWDERQPEEWLAVIARISASPFCLGQNDRGWKASPDWILKPETAAKVLEGKYDPPASKARTASTYDVGAGDEAMAPCRVLGCEEPAHARGTRVCAVHRDEWRSSPQAESLGENAEDGLVLGSLDEWVRHANEGRAS